MPRKIIGVGYGAFDPTFPPTVLDWPNAPGLTAILDDPMDDLTSSEFTYTERDSEWLAATPPVQAPTGPGTRVAVHYPNGFIDGNDPGVISANGITGSETHLYYGFHLMLSPGYQFGGQKLGPFPFELPEPNGTNLFALLWNGNGSWQMWANWGLAAGNRLEPNGATIVTIQAGVWYRMEWEVLLPIGGSDGIIRAWVSTWSGSAWSSPLIQLDYTPSTWNGVTSFNDAQLDFTWGGGAGNKTQEDFIYIGRYYLEAA